MVINKDDFCDNCDHRTGGVTCEYDFAGHRIYLNGCSLGYDLMSTAELCLRPVACKRHKEKEVTEIGVAKFCSVIEE